MNILGAHIDSPRIDVKQNPLYENEEFAYLDTHYYGGIKKYQWVTLPLALHGVVVKKDGTVIEVNIGEKSEDPVFVITDLLVHLAAKQMEKKAGAVIEGEKLDLLFGSRPLEQAEDLEKEEKEAVKKNVLRILEEYYHMEEEDFVSAELEIVPAGSARDCGIDRSMILAYGQDDRVCAFTSLFAMLDTEAPERTACCILVDKEEIGSVGATGMHSRFFENVIAELVALEVRNRSLRYEERFRTRECSRQTSVRLMIRCMQKYLKRGVPLSLPKDWCLTNLPEAAERTDPMMQMRNIWPGSAVRWIRIRWLINLRSLAKWMPAEAAPLHISWQITAWK